MSYEHKVFVMEVARGNHPDGTPYAFAQKVAVYDLCSLGNMCSESFQAIFTKETDYAIFAENGDEDTTTDCYGDRLMSASLGTVIEWLEEECAVSDYRRLRPLLGLLQGFDESQWYGIEIVRYGH